MHEFSRISIHTNKSNYSLKISELNEVKSLSAPTLRGTLKINSMNNLWLHFIILI